MQAIIIILSVVILVYEHKASKKRKELLENKGNEMDSYRKGFEDGVRSVIGDQNDEEDLTVI